MELRRKLWDGYLPIKVNLDTKDQNSIEPPRSLYLMAPRENYFFHILSEVKSMFDSYAPPDKLEAYDEMYFEFNKTPLKWGFPEEQILKLEGMNFFRFHFINALKESQCVRVGSANEILSSMSKKDETRMVDGLIKHNFESFWEINQPLCDKHIAELKKYAIRIVTNRHHTYVQPNIEIKQQIQDDLKSEDPTHITIGDILEQNFPRLFEKQLNDKGDLDLIKKRDFEVIVQGVEVDMQTPLYWMQLNMSYLDNFLYICFHFE